MSRINTKVRARRANKGRKPSRYDWGAPQPEERKAFKKTTKLYVLEVNMMSITKLVDRLRKELDSTYEETEFGPLREFESDDYDKTLIGRNQSTKEAMVIKLSRKTKKGRDNAKAVIEALFLAHGLIPAFFQFKEYEEEVPGMVW